MSLDIAIDIEALTVAFLLDHDPTAALVGSRVYTELPPHPTFPLLRVGRIGGLTGYPGWLDHPRLQVESFGETKADAYDAIATARAALLQQFAGLHGAAVVTSVDEDGGLIWLPDPTGGAGIPARPRYLFAVSMTVHPAS